MQPAQLANVVAQYLRDNKCIETLKNFSKEIGHPILSTTDKNIPSLKSLLTPKTSPDTAQFNLRILLNSHQEMQQKLDRYVAISNRKKGNKKRKENKLPELSDGEKVASAMKKMSTPKRRRLEDRLTGGGGGGGGVISGSENNIARKEPLQALGTPKRRLLEERLCGSNNTKTKRGAAASSSCTIASIQDTKLPFLSPLKSSNARTPMMPLNDRHLASVSNASAVVDNPLDMETEALFLDDLDINAAIEFAYGE